MIKYEKDKVNEVIVTLQERVTISNPFFLMQLISKETKEEVFEFVTDTSSYPNHYNKFSINLTLDIGDYIYNFYQKDTDANTDIENARLLETGKLKVYEERAENTYYEA